MRTGTVYTIGAVVGSIIVLNWYQNRQLTDDRLYSDPAGYETVHLQFHC